MEKKEVLLPVYNKSTAFSDEERKKISTGRIIASGNRNYWDSIATGKKSNVSVN